ncbi:hypothetical protein HIM_10151 [Hirsutella minnesotensis 3608]|uniref:Uncharacterized protein n=1 Tax=Hirsutella minnesotensis 3608 TaxID=1043627 RepID=A0A0F8A2J9_9HYPO|nr:hypothetical protein HIM_10151 [Hirsutella minnesotensis 3608]
MRMRKLGQGQSVVFCVSEEIKGKICACPGKSADSEVSVSDVLLSSISETHTDIRRGLPLWVMQGARFERQKKVWTEITTVDGICMPKAQAERFLMCKPLAAKMAQAIKSVASFSGSGPQTVQVPRQRSPWFQCIELQTMTASQLTD